MAEPDPTPRVVPTGYRCPLCSCHQDDANFRKSQVVGVPICEGCAMDLSHFLEQEEGERDSILDALVAVTGASFQELRTRYYREAVAVFRSKLDPANVDREVADEVKHTRRTAEQTVAHWRRTLEDYEIKLRGLEGQS